MTRSKSKSPSRPKPGKSSRNKQTKNQPKKRPPRKKNAAVTIADNAASDNRSSTGAADSATVRTDPDALGPAVLLLALIFVQLSVLVLGIWLLVRLGAFIELGALVVAFIAEHRLEEHAKQAPSSAMTIILFGLSLCPAAIVAVAFFIRGRATVGLIVLAVVPLLQGFRGFVRWQVKRATAREAKKTS